MLTKAYRLLTLGAAVIVTSSLLYSVSSEVFISIGGVRVNCVLVTLLFGAVLILISLVMFGSQLRLERRGRIQHISSDLTQDER